MTVSVFVGSSVDAIVIVASPLPTAVIFPFASTVTTLLLLDVYVTPLSLASSGFTVTVSLSFLPTSRVMSVLSTTTSSTGTVTVTLTVSVFVGSSLDVIVIVASPLPVAIILPSGNTFTTPGSLVS